MSPTQHWLSGEAPFVQSIMAEVKMSAPVCAEHTILQNTLFGLKPVTIYTSALPAQKGNEKNLKLSHSVPKHLGLILIHHFLTLST